MGFGRKHTWLNCPSVGHQWQKPCNNYGTPWSRLEWTFTPLQLDVDLFAGQRSEEIYVDICGYMWTCRITRKYKEPHTKLYEAITSIISHQQVSFTPS